MMPPSLSMGFALLLKVCISFIIAISSDPYTPNLVQNTLASSAPPLEQAPLSKGGPLIASMGESSAANVASVALSANLNTMAEQTASADQGVPSPSSSAAPINKLASGQFDEQQLHQQQEEAKMKLINLINYTTTVDMGLGLSLNGASATSNASVSLFKVAGDSNVPNNSSTNNNFSIGLAANKKTKQHQHESQKELLDSHKYQTSTGIRSSSSEAAVPRMEETRHLHQDLASSRSSNSLNGSSHDQQAVIIFHHQKQPTPTTGYKQSTNMNPMSNNGDLSDAASIDQAASSQPPLSDENDNIDNDASSSSSSVATGSTPTNGAEAETGFMQIFDEMISFQNVSMKIIQASEMRKQFNRRQGHHLSSSPSSSSSLSSASSSSHSSSTASSSFASSIINGSTEATPSADENSIDHSNQSSIESVGLISKPQQHSPTGNNAVNKNKRPIITLTSLFPSKTALIMNKLLPQHQQQQQQRKQPHTNRRVFLRNPLAPLTGGSTIMKRIRRHTKPIPLASTLVMAPEEDDGTECSKEEDDDESSGSAPPQAPSSSLNEAEASAEGRSIKWLIQKPQLLQQQQQLKTLAKECLKSEQVVTKVIEYNLPASLNELERICERTQFLLNVCWLSRPLPLSLPLSNTAAPIQRNRQHHQHYQHHQQTGNSRSRRKGCESVAQRVGQQQQLRAPLSYTSRVTPIIKERIYWISTNLCQDQEFKRDYVENVQCLSRWSKYQQQSTCASEYERIIRVVSHSQQEQQKPDQSLKEPMEANLEGGEPPMVVNGSEQKQTSSMDDSFDRLGPIGTGASNQNGSSTDNFHSLKVTTSTRAVKPALDLGAITSDLTLLPPPASTTTTTTTTPTPGSFQRPSGFHHMGGSGGTGFRDGDLELRTLCCSFDIFLKCISAQAARDCGQSASKFVVRFFAKLAGEDVRIHCNKYNYMPANILNLTTSSLSSGSPAGAGFCQDWKYSNNNNIQRQKQHHSSVSINRPSSTSFTAAGRPNGNNSKNGNIDNNNNMQASRDRQQQQLLQDQQSQQLSTSGTIRRTSSFVDEGGSEASSNQSYDGARQKIATTHASNYNVAGNQSHHTDGGGINSWLSEQEQGYQNSGALSATLALIDLNSSLIWPLLLASLSMLSMMIEAYLLN